jgi:single-stranded-DNA-specific exonuclease
VGVVGIAANRLLDRFRRPVFLVALEGETGRGSARSPVGFDLPPALAACDDLLEEHGGHARAAGFTIRSDRFEEFRERLERIGAEAMDEPEPEPWDLDATVDLAELSPACVDWLERLEPFGQGNPEPLYGARRLRLAGEPDVVGKGHLRLSLADDGARLRGIAFGFGERRNDLARAERVDAVFHAAFDTFRGTREVRLVVRDVRPSGES